MLDVHGSVITIHESGTGAAFGFRVGLGGDYQPVMRLTLKDESARLFAVERYCFRGSVDGWISLSRPIPLPQAVTKFLKHLGRESFFELY